MLYLKLKVMKSHKSKSIVTVLFMALFVGLLSNQTFGQNQTANWTSHIPNLTETQEVEIENLREDHFQTMDSLRNKYRAAVNKDSKDEARIAMSEEKLEHRKEIKSLLNSEQKEYFSEYSNNHSMGCHQKGWMNKGHGHSNRSHRGNCCNR